MPKETVVARINLNTATADDLMTIPEINSELAVRIVKLRKAQGGFRSVGQLIHVPGMARAKFEKIKDYFEV